MDLDKFLQASDSPFTLSVDELDAKIRHNIKGENRYLDGKTIASASSLSKTVRKSYVYSPFVHSPVIYFYF